MPVPTSSAAIRDSTMFRASVESLLKLVYEFCEERGYIRNGVELQSHSYEQRQQQRAKSANADGRSKAGYLAGETGHAVTYS